MEHTFLISAVLFFFCLAIRSIYELLKEAHRIDPDNKFIFAIVLAAMCILWISWFNLCTVDPVKIYLPQSFRWFALAVFILGLVLAFGALIQLRGVENIDHLVSSGLFKKIRHPMYAGFICWFLGWSLYHTALISLGIGLLGSINVLWWRHLEERRLDIQFGNSYRQYRRTTWF